MSYVKAAKELEYLDERGVEGLRRRYDALDSQRHGDAGEKGVAGDISGSGDDTVGNNRTRGSQSSSKAEHDERERSSGMFGK